jgi:hypothetical protein
MVSENQEIQGEIDKFSAQLTHYLQELGLPADDVLVDISERGMVLVIMPKITGLLNDIQKDRAFYISKFIASCGVGLFDAALNYLWNEIIINLRDKIIGFDLDYFYDSTIRDNSDRIKFRNEDDLLKIPDWQLIQGCRDVGIITQVGYKHLDYIRDMRNFASAAHPNQTQLTGLQLASWLETCIKEVLAKEPSGPVLEVKKLLNSIRTETLDEKCVIPVLHNIHDLPKDLVNSLLRAIFGMYTDPTLSVNARTNINLIAKSAWDQSDDDVRHNIGLKYGIFSVNAEIKRKDLAKEFLTVVDGLRYL